MREGSKYPDDALRVERVEEDGVVVYPLGGGMQGKIHVDHIGKYSVVTDTTPHYRRGYFELEGVPGTFAGWTDGTRWNGWAKPLFEFDVAKKAVEAMDGYYREDVDVFITKTSDDEDAWGWKKIPSPEGGEIKVYPVGCGCWVWDDWMPPMPVEMAVEYVIIQLSPEDIAYARDEARGKSRGFAALHDRCDANMLLPGAEGLEADNEAHTAYMNEVIEAVSQKILS